MVCERTVSGKLKMSKSKNEPMRHLIERALELSDDEQRIAPHEQVPGKAAKKN